MLIRLWVTVTVQGCFMCETDLGTWCLVGAQAPWYEDSNLCLCCVYTKIRMAYISFDKRLFWVLGLEGAGTENIPRTKQRGFYSSSSPHCTYRQCLISAQDLKIRMFVISRTVLFVLSPTIPITIWLFKNGLFFSLAKPEKNNYKKKSRH